MSNKYVCVTDAEIEDSIELIDIVPAARGRSQNHRSANFSNLKDLNEYFDAYDESTYTCRFMSVFKNINTLYIK
jgi:hypothetical protein